MYIFGAYIGLGLMVGALGLILNIAQLLFFAFGLSLIIGCIFGYIKKSIKGIDIAQVVKKNGI